MSNWEELVNSSSEDLIRLYQNFDTGWEEALHVIIHRFRKDLLEKCEIVCTAYKHGISLAETIADQTFEAYAKSRSFDFEKISGMEVDKAFKIYLYRIARNKLTDHYRKQQKAINGNTYDGTESICTELPSISADCLNMEDKIIYEIIQKLPDSHRVVYLTYKMYERKGINLPRKLQEELRAYLGNVKQNTIRTYKKEALDKIQQALDIYKLSQKI